MFDAVVFLISPVNAMVVLPMLFMPANVSFSLPYKKKRLDTGFRRDLQDDPPIDGVSICEGVLAVDGIVFNFKFFDCHFQQGGNLVRIKEELKPTKCCTFASSIYMFTDLQILFNLLNMSCIIPEPRGATSLFL